MVSLMDGQLYLKYEFLVVICRIKNLDVSDLNGALPQIVLETISGREFLRTIVRRVRVNG